MQTDRIFNTVETHTEGMATRIVTGGVGILPGRSMAERRQHLIREQGGLITFLTTEPRGHRAFSGAILQPPVREDADIGVVYIEPSGSLPMCGHGTIGVATAMVETGMVEVVEPVTTIRIDTPAGLVVARVRIQAGRARDVTLRNVASFLHSRDVPLSIPHLPELRCDIAYGGNFYAIVRAEDADLSLAPEGHPALISVGLKIMAALNSDPPVHPADPHISGVKHVQILAPGSNGTKSRNAMVIHPGWFDRSPCGTGTSARLAQLYARNEIDIGDELVNESLIRTRFLGRILGETDVVGQPAIVPEITGRAWVTGLGQWMLDPHDPFPEGFDL